MDKCIDKKYDSPIIAKIPFWMESKVQKPNINLLANKRNNENRKHSIKTTMCICIDAIHMCVFLLNLMRAQIKRIFWIC